MLIIFFFLNIRKSLFKISSCNIRLFLLFLLNLGNHPRTRLQIFTTTLKRSVETFNNRLGRHRWVEYGDKGRYNASQVPAEWHGWLHYITDHTGDELLMLKPQRYGVEHRQNFSGEGDEYIYHSKGHALNPGQRDWTRYQSWQPTKSS